jgi:hypothetical protein
VHSLAGDALRWLPTHVPRWSVTTISTYFTSGVHQMPSGGLSVLFNLLCGFSLSSFLHPLFQCRFTEVLLRVYFWNKNFTYFVAIWHNVLLALRCRSTKVGIAYQRLFKHQTLHTLLLRCRYTKACQWIVIWSTHFYIVCCYFGRSYNIWLSKVC